MLKKIKPGDVSAQFKWDIGAIGDFCSDVLEDANDHNVSLALRAVNANEYDLACEFIQLEKEHRAEGHLTEKLSERRQALVARLRKAASV